MSLLEKCNKIDHFRILTKKNYFYNWYNAKLNNANSIKSILYSFNIKKLNLIDLGRLNLTISTQKIEDLGNKWDIVDLKQP